MNREDRWARAGMLAARGYRVEFEWDKLSDGSPVVMASNPELTGCMAQGATEAEAQKDLEEARQEYICSLLEDGLQVPEPEVMATTGNPYARMLFAVWSQQDDNRVNIRDARDIRGDYLSGVAVVERRLIPA